MDEERKERILEELDKYGDGYPLAQDGDITTRDLIKRYRMSAGTTPLEFMRRAVAADPDLWLMAQVVSRPGSRRWFWVLRRK